MVKKRLVSKTSKHRIVLFDNHTVMREGFAQLINHQPDLQVCGQVGNAGAAMELIGDLKPDLAILSMSLENTTASSLSSRSNCVIPVSGFLFSRCRRNLSMERGLCGRERMVM